MIAGAVSTSGTGNVSCATDTVSPTVATKWMVAAKLKTVPTQAWCVDWTGAAKEVLASTVDTDVIATVSCP
jgi:hypothetical protein